MGIRIVLALGVLIWLPYGIFCFLQPGALAESAQVAATGVTGTVELRAMYGGLQAAIGVLCALALFQPSLQRPALVLLIVVAAGLGTARLIGCLIDGEFSGYNSFALIFEWATAAVSYWVLPPADEELARR